MPKDAAWAAIDAAAPVLFEVSAHLHRAVMPSAVSPGNATSCREPGPATPATGIDLAADPALLGAVQAEFAVQAGAADPSNNTSS